MSHVSFNRMTEEQNINQNRSKKNDRIREYVFYHTGNQMQLPISHGPT